MNIIQKSILSIGVVIITLTAYLYLAASHRVMRVHSWIFGENFQEYPVLLLFIVAVLVLLVILFFMFRDKKSS